MGTGVGKGRRCHVSTVSVYRIIIIEYLDDDNVHIVNAKDNKSVWLLVLL